MASPIIGKQLSIKLGDEIAQRIFTHINTNEKWGTYFSFRFLIGDYDEDEYYKTVYTDMGRKGLTVRVHKPEPQFVVWSFVIGLAEDNIMWAKNIQAPIQFPMVDRNLDTYCITSYQRIKKIVCFRNPNWSRRNGVMKLKLGSTRMEITITQSFLRFNTVEEAEDSIAQVKNVAVEANQLQ